MQTILILANRIIPGKFYFSNGQLDIFPYETGQSSWEYLEIRQYFLCLENKQCKEDNFRDFNEIKILTKDVIGYLSVFSDATFFELV